MGIDLTEHYKFAIIFRLPTNNIQYSSKIDCRIVKNFKNMLFEGCNSKREFSNSQ